MSYTSQMNPNLNTKVTRNEYYNTTPDTQALNVLNYVYTFFNP